MIGIGITTHNRHEILVKTYLEIVKNTPDDTKIVVVDDASDSPVPYTTYRFDKNVGVAKAKNKCLELLQDCEHIFLFDDDTYPIHPEWYKPYVESKEPHLMYQFRLPGKPAGDMRLLTTVDGINAYSHTRGAMLYIKRKVLSIAGGMDTQYGLAMYEHTDWTNRIHNAGLTTFRAMDVVGSEKLLYCMDQDSKIESSIPSDIRLRNITANRQLYQTSKTSKEYKEFRSE